MTQLAILPNYDKKRLKCYGTVAAGEHVNVTITGGTEWVAPGGEAQTLRLRLLFGPHTVGVFPFVTEEMHEEDSETFPTVDEWDTDGEDPTCDLNLNTIQAAKFLKFGGTCLFVLDDPTNDILYATGECEVLSWPKRRGADLPYDLDGYPDFVADAKAAIAQSAANAQTAASNATTAVERVSVALDTANSFVNRSESAATDAEAAAAEARGWAGGTVGGTPSATNNAKYHAERAASEADDAADSANDAVDSAEDAEAWAVGQRGGVDVPSGDDTYENNAKHYAEQAAASAQEAADTLDGKADVATTLAGYGITDAYTKTETDGAIESAISSEVTNRNDAIANAISAVKDSAPAAFDTLKEIADWIGNGQSGAQAVINQVANKVDKVSGKGLSTNDYTTVDKQKLANIEAGANNYVLPTASASTLGGVKVGANLSIDENGVLSATGGGTVDPALSPTSENPVQNKAVAAALAAKLDGAAAYPAWEASPSSAYVAGTVVSYSGRLYRLDNLGLYGPDLPPTEDIEAWTEVLLKDLKQDVLTAQQLAAVNSGATAASVARWDAYSAQIAQKANAASVNAALAQKANATDLPYALVTPGEWDFSGSGYDPTKTYDIYESQGEEFYSYDLVENGTIIESLIDYSTEQVLSIEFFEGQSSSVTATRASLPGHLLDRAGNRVVVSGDTTLTLPAAIPGYIRDFLVRLEISGSTVPTITFAAPTGETIVYETDGDEFPVPDEAGDWLYSFTESCVAHKFAVSLKKVNVVAQGGS